MIVLVLVSVCLSFCSHKNDIDKSAGIKLLV